MAERKVLNKYYPPDYDPAKVPGGTGIKRSAHTVRLMAPFTMRCDTCGEYIYQRKKFNARKETVREENYLGIDIFRFFIKCPRCASEITFKTDPQNTDYTCEHGATRNFEPWRDEKFIEKELNAELAMEEEANPMKALENRTMESKREMEILESLDDIRTVNARTERINPDDVLEKIVAERQRKKLLSKSAQEKEDEDFAKSIFNSADGESVKRALDKEGEELLLKVDKTNLAKFNHHFQTSSSLVSFKQDLKLPIMVKRKLNTELYTNSNKRLEKINPIGLSALCKYKDSDEE